MADLILENVTKSFGKTEVIKGVDLSISDGEFVVFVGPSGCGKSTLLRMISGLEDLTSGNLVIGGRVVNEVRASKRGVAMVFQSYALYPHLTVFENMGFGLKVRKAKKPEIDKRVREAAATLKLDDYLERYPRELSGGQRQRVAIGRAIVSDPEIFLFDEPLSNLDAELRVHMRAEIAALHKRIGNTLIYVTHDQIEAMTLADKIVVLRDGLVEQVGSPRALYQSPKNIFVAQFIGSPKMNILPAGPLAENLKHLGIDAGTVDTVGFRPEHLQVVATDKGLLHGVVTLSEYTGAGSLLHVDVEDAGHCLVLKNGPDTPEAGTRIGLDIEAADVHRFDGGGLRIA